MPLCNRSNANDKWLSAEPCGLWGYEHWGKRSAIRHSMSANRHCPEISHDVPIHPDTCERDPFAAEWVRGDCQSIKELEQDALSCSSFLFWCFGVKLGSKSVFLKKRAVSYNAETTTKKVRSIDKIPKLRTFLFLSVILKITIPGCGSQMWTDDLRVMRFIKHCFSFFFITKNKEKQCFFMPFLWYI